MYRNDLWGLEDLDSIDESPDNKPITWATLHALERDLLLAVAILERAERPTAVHEIKAVVEGWHTGIEGAELYRRLNTLTEKQLLTGTPHRGIDEYCLTTRGVTLLETYTEHLQKICGHGQTDAVTITLEYPITPGDLERAYCNLHTEAVEGVR